MIKSIFRDIDPFWILPYLNEAGDHFPDFFFNSALDWLSFNDKYNELSARVYASSAPTLSNHKV